MPRRAPQFVAITGTEIPPAGAQRSAWLEQRMPAGHAHWWPRTETGLLSLRKHHLEYLAAVPEIRPLLDVHALGQAAARLRPHSAREDRR